MSHQQTVSDPTSPAPQRLRDNVSVIFRVGIGNALEWYDWTVYALFASFVSLQFFDPGDPAASLLATFGIFAVGFFMRPLGGVIFGRIADRFGRRNALTLSMLCAAVGSLLIGISPTYESIGLFATVLLLLARMVQGLGHGGEVVASYAYIAEMAPRLFRGLWSSTVYVFVTIGVLAASLLGAVMTSALGAEAVGQWAWRVPFILGAAAGLYALYLRRSLDETGAFKKARAESEHQQARPFATLFREYKWTMLRLFIFAGGSGVFYYTWGVSAPSFAIAMKGIDPAGALWASVIANVVFIIVLIPFGVLSDKIGRKPLLLMWCVSAVLLAIPLSLLVQDQAWQLGVAMSVGLFIIAPLTAVMPAYYSELFPTKLRGLGVGLPVSLGLALLSGTAPYLQTALATAGNSRFYDIYLMVLAALVAWAVLAGPETKAKDLEN